MVRRGVPRAAREVNTEGDGRMDFSNFLTLMTRPMKDAEIVEELQDACARRGSAWGVREQCTAP